MAQEIGVTITIDEKELDRLYEDLEIESRPRVVVNFDSRAEGKGAKLRTTAGHKARIKEGGSDLLGHYDPAKNVITIANRTTSFRYQSVALIQHQVRWTLLHEARHRWQAEKWSEDEKRRNDEGKYEERVSELDADDFASRHAFDYPGLVSVTTNRKAVRLP